MNGAMLERLGVGEVSKVMYCLGDYDTNFDMGHHWESFDQMGSMI